MASDVFVATEAFLVWHQLQAGTGQGIQDLDRGDFIPTTEGEFVCKPLSPLQLRFGNLVIVFSHPRSFGEMAELPSRMPPVRPRWPRIEGVPFRQEAGKPKCRTATDAIRIST